MPSVAGPNQLSAKTLPGPKTTHGVMRIILIHSLRLPLTKCYDRNYTPPRVTYSPLVGASSADSAPQNQKEQATSVEPLPSKPAHPASVLFMAASQPDQKHRQVGIG